MRFTSMRQPRTGADHRARRQIRPAGRNSLFGGSVRRLPAGAGRSTGLPRGSDLRVQRVPAGAVGPLVTSLFGSSVRRVPARSARAPRSPRSVGGLSYGVHWPSAGWPRSDLAELRYPRTVIESVEKSWNTAFGASAFMSLGDQSLKTSRSSSSAPSGAVRISIT